MSISVTQKFVSQKKAVFIRVLDKNEKLKKAENINLSHKNIQNKVRYSWERTSDHDQ